MNYDRLIEAITEPHAASVGRAARAVNQTLVLRNWVIGAHLVEYEQEGEDRATYGARLVENMAADLRRRGLKGLGVSMLRLSRRFFELYPQIRQSAITESALTTLPEIRQPLITELETASSSTSAKLEKTPSPLPDECLRANWSVRQLQRQVGSLLYERTGLSTDKEAAIDTARTETEGPPVANIAEILRDPYVLEFTGLAERHAYLEKDLETALLDDLQAFLLELGAGFCFEARQKRITVGNEHGYVDLVFYHRILRCHVLIDLKIRAFRHGDAGQMNFYLNYWKDRMMEPGDQSPIGLLLCSDRDHTKVEYATAGLDEPLFVSRYLVALPKPEELQAFIERDRAEIEARVELKSNSEDAL